MKKVGGFLKWSLLYPTIALGICYIFWFLYIPMRFGKWDDIFSAFETGLILFVIYLFFTILLKLSSKRSFLFSLFLPVNLIVLAANLLYLAAYHPTIDDKVEFGRFDYYVITIMDSDFHTPTTFYKCEKWSFKCKGLTGSYGAVGWKISVDIKNKEVRLLNYLNTLEYVDGAKSHWYGSEGQVILDNTTYVLQYYEEDSVRRFVLNKCLSDAADSCTIIPLKISMPQSDDEHEGMVADPGFDELYILSNKRIWYTYGAESLQYEHLDSLKIDRGQYFYYEYHIYSFKRGDSYAYFLYGCGSYFDCWNMPFNYATSRQEEANIKYDKASDKLLVYIGNKLIFVYKGISDGNCYDGGCPNAKCLVDGCEILK